MYRESRGGKSQRAAEKALSSEIRSFDNEDESLTNVPKSSILFYVLVHSTFLRLIAIAISSRTERSLLDGRIFF